MDNQNINVVFLSDSVTKQDRDATDLESWKTEVENKFKNDERFKNTGIEFNVNVKKVDTNPPSLQLNYIGELYGGTTDLKEVVYKGVFGNFIVAESKNSFSVAGSSTTSYTTLLRNVNTQEAQFLEGGSCRHANNVLYCYKHEGGYDLLNYGYGVTTYYKYVFNNSTNKYDNSIIAQSAWNYNPYSGTTTYSYSPSQTVYNEIANDYSSASSDLNTHVNPNGLTYKTNSEMLNLLKKYNPSWTTKEASMYKYDTYNNVFIDNEKGIGYLLFTKGSGTASGYLWAYILWENEIENFLIDLNNYPNFNKTYLVITANNTNNYQQKLNIANSNDSVQTYLYGDSNTLNNFNITNKSSYADFNTILTNLKNQINY